MYKTCRYSRTIGILAHSGAGFSDPVDVAIWKNEFFVLNRSNPFDGPHGGTRIVVCAADESFINEFACYGTEAGQLVWPTAIATGINGRVYVADECRNDVQVWAPDGEFIERLDTDGCDLDGPSGLAVDPDGNLFVVDQGNARVMRFSPTGELRAAFGEKGAGDGQLDRPWGVTVTGHGDVYVADWGNRRVVRFDQDGKHVQTLGEPTAAGPGYGREFPVERRGQVGPGERARALAHREGQLNRPAGVAVDAAGYVYIADHADDRVAVFDPEARFIEALYGDASLSAWAAAFLDGNEKAVRETAPLDSLKHRRGLVDLSPESAFWGPASVRIYDQQRLMVVECARARVQIFECQAGEDG